MGADGRQDLKARTKSFSLAVIQLYSTLPGTTTAQVLGKQMLRSGTSVGAQYWEASHAKSDADFISKIETGLQELNETLYWLELLCDAQIVPPEHIAPLQHEAKELLAIFITIVKKVKSHRNPN